MADSPDGQLLFSPRLAGRHSAVIMRRELAHVTAGLRAIGCLAPLLGMFRSAQLQGAALRALFNLRVPASISG
jgi:hypothetical protein